MVIKAILILALTAVIAAAVGLAFLRFWPSVGRTPDRDELEQRSVHYQDGKFHNEHDTATMTGKADPSSDRRKPRETLRAETPELLTEPQPDDLRFTWFGHSSFLLQMGGINILADPVFSDRSSPVSFAGPKRFSELPVTAEDLPEIDVLFVSHDHYDHLDYRTIRALKDRVGAFVVPLGVDAILRGWGVAAEKIHALDWWESIDLNGTTCTLTPSQHFSGRNPLKSNSTLWGGLYVESGQHRIYYTGDGGYYEVFSEVRERLGAPELMIAECGQYDSAWAKIHMTPEQTVQAAVDAGAAWLIPVHWGSFCICNHAWDDSIRRVTAAAETAGVMTATPEIGLTVDYNDLSDCTRRWWEAYESP